MCLIMNTQNTDARNGYICHEIDENEITISLKSIFIIPFYMMNASKQKLPIGSYVVCIFEIQPSII